MTNELSIRITANSGQLKAELSNAVSSVRNLGNEGVSASEHINTGFSKTRAGLTSISEQLSNARQEIIGFFGIHAAAGLIGNLVGVADSMSKVNAQLNMVTGSQADYARASAELFQIAQQNQAPLAETVTLFSRLAPAIKEAGGSQAHAMGITQAFSDALKVGNATTIESASAMLQFSQAMASGVLRGDEFNSISEASPRILSALADGLGVSRGALRGMAEQGELTSDVIGNALLSQMVKLRDEAAAMPKTIGGSATEMRNEFARMVSDIDRSSGASAILSSALSGVAKHLDDVATVAVLLAGIFAGRMAGAMAMYLAHQASAIAASAQNRAATIAEAQALEQKHRALVAASSAHMGLSSGLRDQAAQSSAAAVAARAHADSLTAVSRAAGFARGALSMLGGPAGVIMFAVSAVAAWSISSADAASKTRQWSNRLDDLQGKLKSVKMQNLNDQIYEAKQRIAELSQAQSAWTVAGELISGKKSQARLAAERELADVNAFLRGALNELDRVKMQKDERLPTSRVGQVVDRGKPKGLSASSELSDEAKQAEEMARAYTHALASTRTAVEEFEAAVGKAMTLYDKFGDADLRDRMLGAAQANFDQSRPDPNQLSTSDQFEVAQQRSMAQSFVSLQEGLKSQNQLYEDAYLERTAVIQNSLMQEITDTQTAQAMMAQITLEHQARMGDSDAKGTLSAKAFKEKSAKDQTKYVLGQMASLTAGAAQQNRAAFEVNKAAGIANALISTYQGAAAALKLGPPASFFLVPLTIAAGLAQVQSIRSQQFTGAGGGAATAPSMGGIGAIGTFPVSPATGMPVNSLNQSQSDKPQQQVTIIVNGNLVDMTQLSRELRKHNIELGDDTI